MGDFIKAKLRTKLFRRTSSRTTPTTSATATTPSSELAPASPLSEAIAGLEARKAIAEEVEPQRPDVDQPLSPTAVDGLADRSDSITFSEHPTLQNSVLSLSPTQDHNPGCPKLVLEAPTPRASIPALDHPIGLPPALGQHTELSTPDQFATSTETREAAGPGTTQTLPDSGSHARTAHTVPHGDRSLAEEPGDSPARAHTTAHATMVQRKIWVKRPGASATRVQVREDDLVDELRDYIVRKYGNSLGRNFDSPDLLIKIVPRIVNGQKHAERMLGPEEEICRVVDQAFPNGQSIEEALIIDIPHRRTPKPSPRTHYLHYHEETARPLENGGDYFPPMPPPLPSPGAATVSSHHSSGTHNNHIHHGEHHQRAMSVLTTGHVPSIPHPPLPSPGGRRHHSSRPKYTRQHTASPTGPNPPNSHLPKQRPHRDSTASDRHLAAPTLLPTPPAQNADGTTVAPMAGLNGINGSLPSTPRVSSPGPRRQKKARKPTQEQPPSSVPTALGLDTSVPPINVLIVEDNHINMKLLEQFIRRLKVRWATAVNGREAVNKWREGGFHLVLMDIQLPIMSGLEATREIRRLERVNGIGVFSGSSASSEAPKLSRGSSAMAVATAGEEEKEREEAKAEDKLDVERLFKSPVIIVALTASALQSDRHEALTAGCNDFLTKPVNFVWFERKVKEWGCMQALIDFDGWRKWKDFADNSSANGAGGSGVRGKAGGASAAAAKKAPLAAGKPTAKKAVLASADSSNVESGGEQSTSS